MRMWLLSIKIEQVVGFPHSPHYYQTYPLWLRLSIYHPTQAVTFVWARNKSGDNYGEKPPNWGKAW